MLLNLLVFCPSLAIAGEASIEFWDGQRKGANYANSKPSEEWFEAAAELGLQFIRVSPDLWPATERDFLIGDADDFRHLNEADLALLEQSLDWANERQLKVVLVLFSLPGCRWKQLNQDRDDGRLWREEKFQEAALDFWRQLAGRLKDHPAVVAYNPLNEPHPDREFGFEDPRSAAFKQWYSEIQCSTADLNRFNRRMVQAIRSVDSRTPILLDGWFYSSPEAFSFLEPVADEKVLYALHNPGPWHFTTYRINQQRFSYPDRMNILPDTPTEQWSRRNLEAIIQPVSDFATRHQIPSNRIVASEFWCDRRVGGAREYLEDLISLYNGRRWHWSFYAFRGDGAWGGLDYELGVEPLGWKFWQGVERGEDPETLKNRRRNPLWEVIRREFKQD